MSTQKQQQQPQQKVIEPYDDLSGVGAPFKTQTSAEYFTKRQKDLEETRKVFLSEGIKGATIFTLATSAAVFTGVFLCRHYTAVT
ncbi:putative FAM18-like protein [Tieghemostelium lacteum]|uniref:Putative FAM18-like protein n=1 Tax=Tieghemostelium lacteum TaxID=361077 RepID=A0A151Z3B8_TIELA|nr:putative FAM18-like protein [Tieghemostelium lacteum]|eukprot:KYQ88438.1 putative FAM18-like protein [Tieghemostelium lacteum]